MFSPAAKPDKASPTEACPELLPPILDDGLQDLPAVFEAPIDAG